MNTCAVCIKVVSRGKIKLEACWSKAYTSEKFSMVVTHTKAAMKVESLQMSPNLGGTVVHHMKSNQLQCT